MGVLFTFSAISCSHLDKKQTLQANVNCDFNPNLSRETQKAAPFLVEYKKAKGTIIFIAANHGEETENHATFELIRQAFQNYKISTSIVEGLENSKGLSPDNYIDSIRSGHRKLGEPAFLALESKIRNIEFLGGEISDKELLERLWEKQFSQKDLAGFYLLRSWVNDSSLTIDKLIKSNHFPIEGQFDSKVDFESWFKKISNTELPLVRDRHLTMPFQNRSDRLQDMANEVTWLRDQYLAKVIKTYYEKKGNVLVVYGSGHFEPQNCFLKQF